MKSDFLPSKNRSGKIRLRPTDVEFPPLTTAPSNQGKSSAKSPAASPYSFEIPDFVQAQFDAVDSQLNGKQLDLSGRLDKDVPPVDVVNSVVVPIATDAATSTFKAALANDSSTSANKHVDAAAGSAENWKGIKSFVDNLGDVSSFPLSGISKTNLDDATGVLTNDLIQHVSSQLHLLNGQNNTDKDKNYRKFVVNLDKGSATNTDKSSTSNLADKTDKGGCNLVGSNSVTAPPAPSWVSLFSSKPKNSGRYFSKNYVIGNGCKPSSDIIDIGYNRWKNHLVGFFLDKSLPYHVVTKHILRVWNLKGKVKIICDNDMFYFEFTSMEDRARILERDPLIIFSRVFIVTKWTPTIDRAREQVESIRVWTRLTSIPSLYQTLEGLDWIFSHVGKLVCFDEATERRDCFAYARALIEITPKKELPTSIPVYLSDHVTRHVQVSFLWKPPICTSCCSFGHCDDVCPQSEIPNAPISLPPQRKAIPRVWRMKPPAPTIPGTPIDIDPPGTPDTELSLMP